MQIKIQIQKRIFLLISLIFLSNISTTLSTKETCVKVYKIDNNLCGELCLSKYISKFAIQFGGVNEGNCEEKNYTIFDHKEKMAVGPFGSFEIDIYRKEKKENELKSLKFLDQKNENTEEAQLKNVLENSIFKGDVTVYKITDGLCGEIILNSYIASFAIQFGGVTEGNCEAVGYTIFDHIEKTSVGPFGNFEVKIYRKN